MPVTARDTSVPPDPAPPGLHQGVCVDVIDLNIVETPFGPKHMARVVWQINETNPKSGKRYLVSRRYPLTLHPKSALSRDLTTWRNKEFTKEERDGFDLERLLGVNCQLQIAHAVNGDRTYANVNAIVPVAKGMEKLVPLDYVRVVNRTTATAAEPEASDDEVPF